MEKKVHLTLTIEEANVVITALAKLPYEVVFKVIDKVRSQAEEQIKQEESFTSG